MCPRERDGLWALRSSNLKTCIYVHSKWRGDREKRELNAEKIHKRENVYNRSAALNTKSRFGYENPKT